MTKKPIQKKEKKVVFLLANSKFMRSFVPDW